MAAGASRRMGRQKLLLPVDGQPMILRVLAAAAEWPVVVVAGADVAAALVPAGVCVIRNDEPERGMAHSLRLAHAAVDARLPLAVLLGDLPDVDAAWIRRVAAGFDDGVDVVVPRAGERFGHPVIFGPRARARLDLLPDGDTLRDLRDDPALRRRIVDMGDGAALTDIDTPADYAARAPDDVTFLR